MSVPETAVYENNFVTGGENKIGLSWQVFFVQDISVSHSMDNASEHHFRRCVLRFNA
jgi:hypothetical protein